jgi:hypothetical protein
MRKFWNVLGLFLALICEARATTPANAIPFEYAENLLWVKVAVPHSPRPLNFLFDTGAEVSVINSDTAMSLGLSGGNEIRVHGVDAATTGRWPVQLAGKAGGIDLPAKYLSLDLSQLSRSCERHLDGLIGADFIRGKVVQIDFQSHLLRLIKHASVAKTDVALPLKISGQCFCAPVSINGGGQQWLRIDTGCTTPLQWVTEADLPTDTTSVAIGLTGLAIPQTKTTISLGDRKFAEVPTGIHARAIFAGESGLLGNALLNRFKTVTIDAKDRRLVLTPL